MRLPQTRTPQVRRECRKSDGQRVTIAPETQTQAVAALQARAAARAADVAPTIRELQAPGAESLRAIAKGLNDASIPTARGRGKWSAVQVQRLLNRIRCSSRIHERDKVIGV